MDLTKRIKKDWDELKWVLYDVSKVLMITKYKRIIWYINICLSL